MSDTRYQENARRDYNHKRSYAESPQGSSSNHHEQRNGVPAQKRIPWGSRSVDIFEKIEQIGEGTYGKVYMAKNKETGEIVALKKIRMANEKEGFPITAIREIKLLKELHHDNIVSLKEIVTSSKANKEKKSPSIYMVFEYMDHDLTGLMLSDTHLWKPTEPQIKCYMRQLLEGLHYCHSKGVLHRDIKGSNLLINNQGQLKLADFGLARGFTDAPANYTNRVITLWYRPPELLLGAVQYGPAIDMWSVGCILAELLTKRAIFPGKNEIDQLDLIFRLCGTPTEEAWPDHAKLPWYHLIAKNQQKVIKRNVRDYFKDQRKEAVDLIDRMLTLDPTKRITAEQALDHDYFWSEPLPCDSKDLPKYPSSHEFQAKKRRGHVPPSNDSSSTKRQRVGSDQQQLPPPHQQPPPQPQQQQHIPPPVRQPHHDPYQMQHGSYRSRPDGPPPHGGQQYPHNVPPPYHHHQGSHQGPSYGRSRPPHGQHGYNDHYNHQGGHHQGSYPPRGRYPPHRRY